MLELNEQTNNAINYCTLCKYLSIYISTYIAPLQGNYSGALPAQARPKRRVLRSLKYVIYYNNKYVCIIVSERL